MDMLRGLLRNQPFLTMLIKTFEKQKGFNMQDR